MTTGGKRNIGYKNSKLKVMTRGGMSEGDIITKIAGHLDQKCVKVISSEPSKSTWKDGIITIAEFEGILSEEIKNKFLEIIF